MRPRPLQGLEQLEPLEQLIWVEVVDLLKSDFTGWQAQPRPEALHGLVQRVEVHPRRRAARQRRSH
jgi:hypothetical protein